jgi:hypothetical protein
LRCNPENHGITGEYTGEEIRHYIEHNVHDTPLKLTPTGEGVASTPSTFDTQTPTSIVNVIQARQNDITKSRVIEEQKKNCFCKEVVNFFVEGKCPHPSEG